jgi:hypothetical protein
MTPCSLLNIVSEENTASIFRVEPHNPGDHNMNQGIRLPQSCRAPLHIDSNPDLSQRRNAVPTATQLRSDRRQSETETGCRLNSVGYLLHSVQTVSGAHLVSYPMGTQGYFPRGKADQAVKLTRPSSAEVMNGWSYTSYPSICIHGVVLMKQGECSTIAHSTTILYYIGTHDQMFLYSVRVRV